MICDTNDIHNYNIENDKRYIDHDMITLFGASNLDIYIWFFSWLFDYYYLLIINFQQDFVEF